MITQKTLVIVEESERLMNVLVSMGYGESSEKTRIHSNAESLSLQRLCNVIKDYKSYYREIYGLDNHRTILAGIVYRNLLKDICLYELDN